MAHRRQVGAAPWPPDRLEAMSPAPRPTVAGPILAYRQWRMENVHLVSATVGLRWPQGLPLRSEMAGAMMGWSTSAAAILRPGGSYAAKDWRALQYHLGAEGATVVTGQVALWGHVVEHERGYRAEYAYPVALFLPPRVAQPMAGFPAVETSFERQVRCVAAAYGIAVLPAPEAGP